MPLSSRFVKQGIFAFASLVFSGPSVLPCWGQDVPNFQPTVISDGGNIAAPDAGAIAVPDAGPASVPSALENNRPLATVPLPDLIDEAIAVTSRRPLNADEHTPWQIMHGVLALRDNYYIIKDGKPIKAARLDCVRADVRRQTLVDGHAARWQRPPVYEALPF